MPVSGRTRTRRLYVDALLLEPDRSRCCSPANRAYFLVDMEVPSAYVAFLHSMLPDKTAAELYTMVGLQKQGKTLFYRDFLHHLRHSTDAFVLAPGIKGLVMSVFTLPSFPYVFKVIRDRSRRPRTSTGDGQAQVPAGEAPRPRRPHGRHPRVLGRAFPRARFDPALLEELERAPSQLEATAIAW